MESSSPVGSLKKRTEMEIESDLLVTMSGCTVSPRHEAKRAGRGFRMSASPNDTPRRSSLSRRHRHNVSLGREPDGLRTPRDPEEDEDEETNKQSQRQRPFLRSFDPSYTGRQRLSVNSRKNVSSSMDQKESQMTAQLSYPFTTVSDTSDMDAESTDNMPPPAPVAPLPPRSPFPSERLSDTPTSRRSPLLTAKHSQNRGGFQWNLTSPGYKSMSFPRSRPNPLKSPKKRSMRYVESSGVASPISIEEKTARSKTAPSYHMVSSSAVAFRSLKDNSNINIPDLHIDTDKSEVQVKSKRHPHRRSPSVQHIPRHRPPPLDLFEIVRLPQPVVGIQICPEIADPSKRPDSIEWWRKVQSENKTVEWIRVSDNWEYTPTVKDIGCVLRVNLMVNKKPYVDFSNPVIPHPTTPSPRPWKNLPHRTASMDTKSFRLLTWNTLADAATRNGFGGKCPGWALQWPYRKDNLLKHIRAYDADIICMQEIDKKYWHTHWRQSFQNLGYEGEYGGSTSYGCAIFYRKSVFRKVRSEVFSLDTAIQWAQEMRTRCIGIKRRMSGFMESPFNSSHYDNLSHAERLKKLFEDECRVLRCGRKALIFELERIKPEEVSPFMLTRSLGKPPQTPHGGSFQGFTTPKVEIKSQERSYKSMKRSEEKRDRVFVVTTHLYKSDTRPWSFIRLLQSHVLMEKLKIMTHGVENPRIIIAGDFNSGPQSSVYRYMQSGMVRSDDADIKGCAVIPCDLKNPFLLRSAYATILGHEQRYRRKKSQQTPVVEYVWCSGRLIPLGVVPIPHDSAEKFAVEKLSSDHQPLVVDVASVSDSTPFPSFSSTTMKNFNTK
mmetsp:Transcript_7974/g.12050  ORF Transcript_7974/g.12050 Transcript_7974/m.12050 type:complete len:831 (-) Transcript_7974:7-2499(-)